MKIKIHNSGYSLWLSAKDTYAWAHKPGASWPCSTVSGNRLFISVDSNGLCDITINGHASSEGMDIDGSELDAIVSDHLPVDARKYWPVWSR